jgi:ubiquinone biosynthesis protein UbiJ
VKVGRLLLAIGYLVGGVVLFDAAAEELARFVGEVFAETVVAVANETEGIEENAD